jgi:hypothetical protein
MSNIDVGTEHLRWMGDTRFLLGLLWVSGDSIVIPVPGSIACGAVQRLVANAKQQWSGSLHVLLQHDNCSWGQGSGSCNVIIRDLAAAMYDRQCTNFAVPCLVIISVLVTKLAAVWCDLQPCTLLAVMACRRLSSREATQQASHGFQQRKIAAAQAPQQQQQNAEAAASST